MRLLFWSQHGKRVPFRIHEIARLTSRITNSPKSFKKLITAHQGPSRATEPGAESLRFPQRKPSSTSSATMDWILGEGECKNSSA